MDDETLLIIAGAAVAGLILYKTAGKGLTTAFTGAGNAVGSTGDAVAQISKTTGETISNDISLFDIKKDLGLFVNFFQNLNPKNANKGTWLI